MFNFQSKLLFSLLGCLIFQVIPLASTLAQEKIETYSWQTEQLQKTLEESSILLNVFLESPFSDLLIQDSRMIESYHLPQLTLPASSAVTITFCSNIKFDAEQSSSFPVTVFLARPLLDTEGNIIAPINSLVSATVTPTDKGVKIQANALVIGGQYIPIETPTLSVPILSEVQRQNNYYSNYGYQQQNPSVYFNVANNLQGWLNVQGILDDGTSDVIGAGLAIASGVSLGLSSKEPEETKTAEVSQGVMLIFPLLSAVQLPQTAILSNARYVSQTAYSTTLPCTVDSSTPSPGYSPRNPIYETNNPRSGYTPTNTMRYSDYD